MKFSSFPKHHALLITRVDRVNYSKELWEEMKSSSLAHRYFDQTVLDINTAREIISWAKTPYSEERVGLISFHTAGIPAQNAMLKILEEPPINTRFVLVTSNKEGLISTVLSRVQHVEVLNTTREESPDSLLFLKTTQEERMKLPFVIDLLNKTDEGDRKDRESIRFFILSLAKILSEKNVSSNYQSETLQLASYASDSSSSGKALVEYLSLLLPQLK